MTNKELIEKAAEKLGLIGYHCYDSFGRGEYFVVPGEIPRFWNPLESNDDSVALEVAFQIQIIYGISGLSAMILTFDGIFYEKYSDHPDKASAKRKAIVRVFVGDFR